MCKHILNAQVSIRSPCCNKWYECAECHDEVENHHFQFARALRLTCKQCKKCFDRDFMLFPDSDKKCDFCKNVWSLPAITPESKIFYDCINTMDEYFCTIIDPSHSYFGNFE